MINYFVSVFKWALILLGSEVVKIGALQIWNAVYEAKTRGGAVEVTWALCLCQFVVVISLAIRYFLRLIDPVWRLTGIRLEEMPSDDSQLRNRIVAHADNRVLTCIGLSALVEFVCLYHSAVAIGPSKLDLWLMYLSYLPIVDAIWIVATYCAVGDVLLGPSPILFHHMNPAVSVMTDYLGWDVLDWLSIITGLWLSRGELDRVLLLTVSAAIIWWAPRWSPRITRVQVITTVGLSIVFARNLSSNLPMLCGIVPGVSACVGRLCGMRNMTVAILLVLFEALSLFQFLLYAGDCPQMTNGSSSYGLVVAVVLAFGCVVSFSNIRANQSLYSINSRVLRLKMF